MLALICINQKKVLLLQNKILVYEKNVNASFSWLLIYELDKSKNL